MNRRIGIVLILTILVIVWIGMNVNDYLDDEQPWPTAISTATSTAVPVATATNSATEISPPTATKVEQPTATQELPPTLTATPYKVYITLRDDFEYSYANVRLYPNTSSQIVDKFYVGEQRELLSVSGEWYEIPSGDHTAWIASWICQFVDD